MIYGYIIKELEKYSFITRIKYVDNFYIKMFYKINGIERYSSISRRASPEQLSIAVKKIKLVADRPPNPKFENELPIEIIKYEVD